MIRFLWRDVEVVRFAPGEKTMDGVGGEWFVIVSPRGFSYAPTMGEILDNFRFEIRCWRRVA